MITNDTDELKKFEGIMKSQKETMDEELGAMKRHFGLPAWGKNILQMKLIF